MPKLLPQTEKIRAKRFLKALERTGSPRKAAMETLDIGSRGAKDLYNSASSAGAQMLERIKPTILEAFEQEGITPKKLAVRNNELLDSQDPMWINKAIDTSLKVGVGGGYAAEKHETKSVNLHIGKQLTAEQIAEIDKIAFDA